MFGRKESKETNGGYSPRNQRSCLAQRKLEQDRERCEGLIGYLDRKISALEKTKEAQLRHRVEGRGSATFPLGAILTELEENKAERAAFEERKGLINSQIEALVNLIPSQAAKRTEWQTTLARLVDNRLEKDRQIEAVLKQVRQLLEQRADLSAKVTEAASAVELTVNGDGLDEQRFKLLAHSLPTELAATSERWAAWFVGEQEKVKPYIVVVDEVILPETLARAGFYRFGDAVQLTDAEASELGEICPIGRARHDVPWTYEPPRIMPLETFERLLREAPDKGSTPQDLVSGRNAEREEQLKQQYTVEYEEAVRERRKAMRAEGSLIGGDPRND